MGDLSRTPLYDNHVRLGARIVPFAGWEMPVQYSGIIAEHKAVRSAAGIFDVSHMGRLWLLGRDAVAFAQHILTADISQIAMGRAKYSPMCNADGGIIDDTITYRIADDRLLLVCNAGSKPRVAAHLKEWQARFNDLSIVDFTNESVMIACQGPKAIGIVERITHGVSDLKQYSCKGTTVGGEESLVARTGYTGEDGAEIICPASRGPALWGTLVSMGAVPCGLGARDTLRLEAGMCLYGNDIDLTTNPLEAGLSQYVSLEKPDFVGKQALLKVSREGVRRRLIGFKMLEKGPVSRHGFNIIYQRQPVGTVTSGSYTPTLDMNIGMGYVPVDLSQNGTRLEVDIRGKSSAIEVARLPFYRRPKK